MLVLVEEGQSTTLSIRLSHTWTSQSHMCITPMHLSTISGRKRDDGTPRPLRPAGLSSLAHSFSTPCHPTQQVPTPSFNRPFKATRQTTVAPSTRLQLVQEKVPLAPTPVRKLVTLQGQFSSLRFGSCISHVPVQVVPNWPALPSPGVTEVGKSVAPQPEGISVLGAFGLRVLTLHDLHPHFPSFLYLLLLNLPWRTFVSGLLGTVSPPLDK